MSKVKLIQLSNAVKYSEERISHLELNSQNYVGTDNLLQNKLGKTFAEYTPTKGNTTKYSEGDILIGNIRPYLKKIWYAKCNGGSSPDVLTLKVNSNFDSRFVYYSLLRDDFFSHIMKGSKGTKMPRGDKNQVLSFLIPDLEINFQKKISAVFSSIDAKIELNNKVNLELEDLAITLFNYWFVQFDFPDKNGKPYKINGGKMEWNEAIKREIPIGWKDGELKDIANITMGQSPSGDTYNENQEGVIFFQGCTDFGNRFPTIRQYTTKPSRFAKEGDILLSVRAPVGTLNIAKEDCCIGRGLASLNSKDNCLPYLFGVMLNLKHIFDRRNVDGTTFGSITKDDLFSLKIIKPENEILKKYNSIVNPIFQKQNKIELENLELIQLRDWLIPLLMNGQISAGK